MKSIIEAFEQAANKYEEKKAVGDEHSSLTYRELKEQAKALSRAIEVEQIGKNKPVVIALNKSVKTIVALLGVVYSGNFYTILDQQMPKERMDKMMKNLSPALIITEEENFFVEVEKTKIISYEAAIEANKFKGNEQRVTHNRLETDPLYILYTSGSTGVPKGVVINHRNVLAYSDWVISTFQITHETIFGNQTPFYFSMSVLDIFSSLFTGATLEILPKSLFSFPLRLLEYVNEKKINTIYWVPSALSIVANSRTLDYITLPYLEKVLFAGEVMPVKQLNVWMDHMPDLLYANLYGPTETTDICAYYVVKKRFKETTSLPIGYACDNCELFIFDDQMKRTKPGEIGELYVRSPFVAMGYFGQFEKTAEVFVQNPLNPFYPEYLYKTGDLVKLGTEKELLYCGRKDFQIKHMGYRIELGEIEAAAIAIEKMEHVVCIYEKDKIHMIYQARLGIEEVRAEMKKKVPAYMLPSEYLKEKKMKLNANGKIDRAWYANHYGQLNPKNV